MYKFCMYKLNNFRLRRLGLRPKTRSGSAPDPAGGSRPQTPLERGLGRSPNGAGAPSYIPATPTIFFRGSGWSPNSLRT